MPKCPFCNKRTDTGIEIQDHINQKHPEEMVVGSAENRRLKKRKRKRSKGDPIVIDGNNVAYANGKPAQVNLIKQCRMRAKKAGYDPIVYVSAALRFDIDNETELNRLINIGWVREVEGGEDDDELLIEEAYRKECEIISNDGFQEYRGTYEKDNWKIADNLKKFTLVDGKIKL